MAEAIVSFAVETIGNLLIQETNFLSGVRDEVEQLRLELKRLQSFLKDADARQHEKEMLKVWISQARDLAYEADDLIESYAFKVASRRRRNNIKGAIKRCACILNECYATHTIGSNIKTLKAKISDLIESFQKYGIIRGAMDSQEDRSLDIQQLRRTYSHVVDDDFVGLEGDVEVLVKNLLMESKHDDQEIEQHFRVVSIYGMGGLGKTTLARKVYNHPQVKLHFDHFAWVYVSQKWQKVDVLRQILGSLSPEMSKDIKGWSDEKLVRQLFQIQQNKKCLVVLDDVWSTDAWECIKHAFPVRNDGSKILVTSRDKNVTLHIDPIGFHHQPRLLSDDESWQLLQKKALWGRFNRETENLQELENLGKEMVKACRGLPLAVTVLGGTLATKKNLKEWENVNKRIKSILGRGDNVVEEKGSLHKILALSYDNLPYKLKSCFLYLGRFEEDVEVDTETLYLLWMGEGLISTKDRIGDESMMDVAERYLGELVIRCMVQGKAFADDVFTIYSIGRSFASCRLHDLMRDLCLLKAKEENFLLSISCGDDDDDDDGGIIDERVDTSSSSLAANNDQSHEIYRMVIRSFRMDVRKYVTLANQIERNTRHLRSFALLVNSGYEGGRILKKMKSQFKRFKLLRVLQIEGLDLTNYGNGNDERILMEIISVLSVKVDHIRFPKAIGKLIHLRYFSLGNTSFFLFLPSSLGNLYNLKILDLRDAYILRIPNMLWKMRQLICLYLPNTYDEAMGILREHKLNLCCSNKLRLKGLDKLEILGNFCPPTCSSQDLSTLRNLRALSAVVDIEDFDSDEDFAREMYRLLSNTDHHVHCKLSLRIKCTGGSEATKKKLMSDVVGQCFSCRNLQILVVFCPRGQFSKVRTPTHLCKWSG